MLKRATFTFLLIVSCLVLVASPVIAASIAMSGNFYMADLQARQGETIYYSDVYVIVFNHNDYVLDYIIETTAPDGVTIQWSRYGGSIPASTGESPAYVYVYMESISATKDVAAGTYPVSVMASCIFYDDGGIAIGGGVQMSNTLTVLPSGKKGHSDWGHSDKSGINPSGKTKPHGS